MERNKNLTLRSEVLLALTHVFKIMDYKYILWT